MGGRGGSGGANKNGKSDLERALEYARSISQKKANAIKSGSNRISYKYDGKTYNQYYYGGSWHDRPSTLTRTRQYQTGDIEKIIQSQRRRRRR